MMSLRMEKGWSGSGGRMWMDGSAKCGRPQKKLEHTAIMYSSHAKKLALFAILGRKEICLAFYGETKF